jgi:ribonuclease HI
MVEKMSGPKFQTTNNEMELSAVLYGIKYICQTNNIKVDKSELYTNSLFSNNSDKIFSEKITLDIYLDSQYVRQGVLDYLEDRKKR